jgi:DNA-binding protein H-NS
MAKKQFTDKDVAALDSIPEVDALIEKLTARREEIEAEIKDTVLEDVINLIESKGLDRNVLKELIVEAGATKTRKTRTPAPQKYRLPDGTEWTGLGRMKKAFAIYLEENSDVELESLLIEK